MNLFQYDPHIIGQADFGIASVAEVEGLEKALTAGAGTDSASMTGGRSLIPQDIEMTLVSALAFKKQDFKLFNMLKNVKIGSTVHEYTRRNDVGDETLIFVAEGADSVETNQTLERVTRITKFMQTYRKLTLQMQTARTIEDAEASEKMSGMLTILKGAEWGLFHGNGSVVPDQFDSVLTQILAASSRQNVVDQRGLDMTTLTAERNISEIARQIYENGGYATHCFMPPIIGTDFQTLVKDRVRFNTGDTRGAVVIEEFPTPFSENIKIAGTEAGPDKFFRLRGKPVAGSATAKPNAPSIALTPQSKTGGTGFDALTAGTYYWTVHAVDGNGISAASTAQSAGPTAGQEVSIVITHDGSKPGTGFIVCRSKVGAADGTDCREMFRVAKAVGATTTVLDRNDWLPGCADLLYLTFDSVQPTVQWDQFLPAMRFDLFPSTSAIIPFLIVLFGTPDVKIPWYNGIVKNVGYSTMGWF
jgi:hypothetical protein